MDVHEAYALLLATAEPHGDCLLATIGSPTRGYRKLWVDGRGYFVHRLVAEVTVGRPLLPGRTESVDHVCHNRDLNCNLGENCPHRRCVQPSHLELLDQTENWRRGREGVQAKRRALTHCPKGHPYTEESSAYYITKGWRRCKVCHRDRERARRDTERS